MCFSDYNNPQESAPTTVQRRRLALPNALAELQSDLPAWPCRR
jgi:hypothetical protein